MLATLDLIHGDIAGGTIDTSSQTEPYTLENGSISASLAGSGSVTVSGGGVVDLTGDNSELTGGISIASGTLGVNSDAAPAPAATLWRSRTLILRKAARCKRSRP